MIGTSVEEKHKGMLHDHPKKLALRKKPVQEPPISVMIHEPYIDAAKRPMEEMLKTETMAKSGLVVSIGNLRPDDAGTFLAGDFHLFSRSKPAFIYTRKHM